MASARKIGSKWYYRITLKSRKSIERGGFNTKEEALKVGNYIEMKIKEENVQSEAFPKTYKALADEWITDYAETVYKQTTIDGHKKVLKNHLYPTLQNLDPFTITTKQLQNLINEKIEEGHTHEGINRIKVTMKKSLDYGVQMGYLKDNPASKVKLPSPRSKAAEKLKPKRETKASSKDLINAIFERFPEGHPCYIPLLLGYRCGLRLGEAYGLCIDDVDLNKKTITIRRQIQYDESTNELYFSNPKYCMPGETRTIDIDETTYEVLNRQITKMLTLAPIMNYPRYYEDERHYIHKDDGSNAGKQVIFVNSRLKDGTYVAPRTMQHVSRVIHGKTGVFDYPDETWDFHELRHTHASECIEAGMNPVAVQHRLGHKNLETTYRYYIHLTEKEADEARDTVEMMFNPNYKPTDKVIKGHFKEVEVCAQ